MGWQIVLTFPNHFAVRLVESQQGLSGTASVHKNQLTFENWRSRILPLDDGPTVLGHQVVLPDLFAVDGIQAGENLVGTQKIRAIAIHRWRRARAVAALLVVSRLPQRRRPKFFPGAGIERNGHFPVLAIDAALDKTESAVATDHE